MQGRGPHGDRARAGAKAMTQWATSRLTNGLVSVAAVVVILAGMKAAAPIIVPVLLAAFIGIITTPFFITLRRRGIPTMPALAAIAVVLVLLGIVGVAALTQSLTDLSASLPGYLEGLQTRMNQGLDWLASKGMDEPAGALSDALTTKNIMNVAGDTISSVSTVLGSAFLIVVIVVFGLLEAALLPARVRALPGMTEPTWQRLEQVVDNVRRYVGLKTLVALLNGFLIWLLLTIFGVKYALLLGILAFMFDYVPNFGAILAAVPGVLLALAQYGVARAAMVLVGYVVISAAVGSFLEPRVMGMRFNLSPVVVILSLIFWGWVLGPVGMLLSVPLTMTAKVALESMEETRSVGLLLGSSPPKEAEAEEEKDQE